FTPGRYADRDTHNSGGDAMTQAQLIDTWRSLFTERTSSPAIERFLGVLTDTPYRWRVTPEGKIRAYLGDAEACVITGAVRHWTRARFSVGDWVRAADVLGLSYAEAGCIVEAADAVEPVTAKARRLRRRLLAATRVGLSPWASPAPRRLSEGRSRASLSPRR